MEETQVTMEKVPVSPSIAPQASVTDTVSFPSASLQSYESLSPKVADLSQSNNGVPVTSSSLLSELSSQMLQSAPNPAPSDVTDILKPPPPAAESNVVPTRQRTPVEDVNSNADADELLSFGSLSEVSPGKVSSIASTPEPMLVSESTPVATIKCEGEPPSVQPRSRTSSQSSRTKSPSAKKKKPPKPKNDENMQDGRNDFYCWVCHREGEVLCCELCPRVFHAKCMHLVQEPEGDWHCPECQKVMEVECKETQSRAMSQLNIDQLALHLRYALQRMKTTGSEPFLEPVDTKTFTDYLEYVFHPMDLNSLEKNIKKRKYGSTEAFLADVKWILHNCVIYNGLQTKLTHIAKTMVKIAQHEMSEIEVCPECYLNSCRKRENWFCEPCKEPHILVWAKLQGFPHWPAKALRIDKGMVDARFFGQHDRAWIALSGCYLMSKEMPLPVKNKKKGRGPGAKGGLDNAMIECNHYIDNVVKKYGEFDYAPPRTPLTHMDLYRKSTDIKGDQKALDFPGKNIKIKEEVVDSQSKSSEDKILNLNLGNSDMIEGLTTTPQKRSKVVTTSGAHPRSMQKKFAPKKKGSMAMLEKTIESCKNSLLESIQNDSDESTTDESDSSSEDEDAAKSSTQDKTWNEANAKMENDDLESELIMDISDGKSQKNKKDNPASNLVEKGFAKIKKKSSVSGSDNRPIKTKSILTKRDGETPKKLGSNVPMRNPKGVGGIKRKIDEDHSSSSSNLPAGKISKVDLLNKDKKKHILLLTEPPKLKPDRDLDGGKLKKIGDSQKTKILSSSQVVRKKSILKTDDGKGDKSNLKSAAKLLSQKVMNRKTHPEKSFKSLEDKSKSSMIEPTKKLSTFTIPKHKPVSNITKRTENDMSDKQHNVGKSTEVPHTTTSNFPVQKLQKYSDKVMHGVQQVLVEMYEDMMVLFDEKSGKDHNQENKQASEELAQVRLELEKLKWMHRQEIAELQHNHDLTIAEIRQSLENDKTQHVNDIKSKYEKEKKEVIEETKKKQWCANCGKEAIFYCCWNTSYCDYPCQQLHWPKHMATCSQNSAAALATPTTPKETNPLADIPTESQHVEDKESKEVRNPPLEEEKQPQKMEESAMSEVEEDVEDSDNDDMVIDESGPKETPGVSAEQVSPESPEESKTPTEKQFENTTEPKSEPEITATTSTVQTPIVSSIITDSNFKLSESITTSAPEDIAQSELTTTDAVSKEIKEEMITAENKTESETNEDLKSTDEELVINSSINKDSEKTELLLTVPSQENQDAKVEEDNEITNKVETFTPTSPLHFETPLSPDLLALGDDPLPVVEENVEIERKIEERLDFLEHQTDKMTSDNQSKNHDNIVDESKDDILQNVEKPDHSEEQKTVDSIESTEPDSAASPVLETEVNPHFDDEKMKTETTEKSLFPPIFSDSYLTSLQNQNQPLNIQSDTPADEVMEIDLDPAVSKAE